MPYYAIIGGPEPGIANNWPDASRRTNGHKGSYPKRTDTREEAEAYYEETTGGPPPVYTARERPPVLPRIRVENEHGVLATHPTDEMVAGLKALGLWP